MHFKRGIQLHSRVTYWHWYSSNKTQTDTETTDFSKTHTETNTEKICNTDTIHRYRNDKEKFFTETVIEMILKTDTEMIGCLSLKFFQRASFIYLFTGTSSSF